MDKGKIKFLNNPVRWLFFYLLLPALPLIQRAQCVTLWIKFMNWKKSVKNKIFGELTIKVVNSSEWTMIEDEVGEYRCRVASVYRYRKHFPWIPLTKTMVGVQFIDEDAFPYIGTPSEMVDKFTQLRININNINKETAIKNENRLKHKKLKDALLNPETPNHLKV